MSTVCVSHAAWLSLGFLVQEAGYKQALKCNGEYIDEQRLKVEPCISAGPKLSNKSKKADRSSQRMHAAPAPKASLQEFTITS